MTRATAREEMRARRKAEAAAQQRRVRRRRWFGWTAAVAVVVAIVAMLVTSQTTSASTSTPAPDFTLRTTTDTSVTLSSLRGSPVLLYFSEGAGCGACITQMGEIEKRKADFDALGITVLPIVMNTKEDITSDTVHYGVTTPFLLDDGTVSKAYGTLGKGMHTELPGHSFVLVDAAGVQRWYGEYPSMYLSPNDLLTQIRSRLGS
ncbi:MAG: peroxiredoxin family protein [Actinobacteria bacterium]|nr:peroxiredoxin family protein [Actinomycetota bacterium]